MLQNKESSDEAESSASDDDSDDQQNKAQSTVDEDDDDEAEWERLTKKHNQREKALEGKSKVSHSVHCPYFTDDKQEFWWVYLSDKKNRLLVTPPHHVTSLVEREEVELKFTAPPKPGMLFWSAYHYHSDFEFLNFRTLHIYRQCQVRLLLGGWCHTRYQTRCSWGSWYSWFTCTMGVWGWRWRRKQQGWGKWWRIRHRWRFRWRWRLTSLFP